MSIEDAPDIAVLLFSLKVYFAPKSRRSWRVAVNSGVLEKLLKLTAQCVPAFIHFLMRGFGQWVGDCLGCISFSGVLRLRQYAFAFCFAVTVNVLIDPFNSSLNAFAGFGEVRFLMKWRLELRCQVFAFERNLVDFDSNPFRPV